MKCIRKGNVILAVCIAVALSGCGGGNSGGSADANKGTAEVKPIQITEPVTVKLNVSANYLNEDEVRQYVIDPVKSKYPNITIALTNLNPNLKNFQDMIASGEIPDLLVTSSNLMDPIKTVGFATNIEPYLKAVNLDLSQFEQGSLQAIKTSSGGDYMSALPYSRNYNVLFYNKDLFDKFGVPYPKDGMTWADATDLAKKMTRQDGGVAYRGLVFDSVHRPASQLVLGYVDPKTLKATVNTEKWKRVYEMEKNVYDIPGNSYATGGLAMFMKDKILAMFPTVNASDQMAATPDLNWDMASYPSFPEAPGVGVNYDLHVMAITANSQHKDAAALVLSVLLSEGVQQNIAKNGRISVLKNDQLRSVFGQNVSYLKGKNIDAIFKSTPAANYPPTEFDTQARAVMNNDTANAVFKDHLDINTALQQADEAINKIVAENKTQ